MGRGENTGENRGENTGTSSSSIPSTFSFASASYSVTEGNSVTAVVVRNGDNDGYLSTTVNVPAGTYFAANSYPLTFAPGDTQKSVVVSTISTTGDQGGGTSVWTISGYAASSGASTTITITDSNTSTAGLVMSGTPFIDDGFEYTSLANALATGPWDDYREVSNPPIITTAQAHSGTRSLSIPYAANEQKREIWVNVPNSLGGTQSFGDNDGANQIEVEWWEYRPATYDWAGEKFNHMFGRLPNGNVNLWYVLGWPATSTGFGTAGVTDPPTNSVIQQFGNSVYSNGQDHFTVSPMSVFTLGAWHKFNWYVDLGTLGVSNGMCSLYIDGTKIAERLNVRLRPSVQQDGITPITVSYTIDTVAFGGWYSGVGAPVPNPATRYIDDVRIWRD